MSYHQYPGSRYPAYPGMLWYSRMPQPRAGEPRTMGTQCQGYGQVPNCVGISIASSFRQYALPWAASRGRLREKDVMVRTDNTATVAYIKRQGSLRSRRMSQLARHLLLWSQKHLRSLRAIHIPGVFNQAANHLLEQHFQGSRDSIPRGFSWFGDGSELLRWTCLHLRKPPTASGSTP